MIRRLLAAWRAYRQAEIARRMLYGLSDHTLRDIGLRRDQIPLLDQSRFKR